MKAVKLAVRRFAIGLALKKPAPAIIPLSGPERLRSRDYCVVTLGSRDGELFMAEKMLPTGIEGREWAGRGSDHVQVTKANPRILTPPLKIKHYYRDIELDYGAPEFCLTAVLPLSRLYWYRATLKVWLYGRKPVVRQERHVVLRWAYEHHISGAAGNIDVHRYLGDTDGPLWHTHPMAEQQQRYYSLVLDSLAETGELKTVAPMCYQLMPKALSTLAALEADDRKHTDSVNQQRRMFWLTAGVLIVGIPAALDAGFKLITAMQG